MDKTNTIGIEMTRARPRGPSMDLAIHVAVGGCAFVVILLVVGIFLELVSGSRLAIERHGWSFLVTNSWDPVNGQFGALSSIFGTAATTIIALALAVPLSLAIALFLVEMAPPMLAAVVGGAIELLAAIPSIIYGMWGLFLFAPFMADRVQPLIQRLTGEEFSLFSGPPMGIGMLTAGLVLALMVLPFMTAITRDVFKMMPPVLRESGYALGATTFEVTRKVTIPHTIRGIIGAAFLSLGRALGETMAVTFVIGNDHGISASLFASGNTIASTLANEFSEADGLHLSALIELGLVLLVITLLVQIAAQIWLGWMRRGRGNQ